MESPDVNVLIYAFDESASRHADYLAWLDARVNGTEPFALAEPVWSGFLRITTNQRLFQKPVSLERSLAFIERVRSGRMCRPLLPGTRHWEIFLRLCRETNAMANDIPDAYLAALAIGADCEWITTDGGFSRFNGLRSPHTGFEVNTIESTLGPADIHVTATSNCDIITFEHMQRDCLRPSFRSSNVLRHEHG